MTTVAIYTRYSSDNQKETSIEDQQRLCRQYAERNGWPVEYEYADMELSGRFDDRPQFKALMADAKNGRFDTLIVFDLSRLSRSTATSTLVEQFRYHGVRLIAVSDGIDSAQKGSKLQVGMKAMMNNAFLDQLKENVHRGLEGNALKGYNTGGRTYGYRNVPCYSETRTDIYGRPEIDYVTREIDEEQARWVRQIFAWVAEGRSINWVAKELNRQGAKPPQSKGWTSSTLSGNSQHPHYGILNNPLYLGILYWNRTENIYDPVTGKQGSRSRDEKEWVRLDKPELRIVDDVTWQSVKDRQAAQRERSNAKRGASHPAARTGPGPKFILSGLLKCAECGGSMSIFKPGHYRCSNAHRRGAGICSNKQFLVKAEVEDVLLASLRQDLFSEEAVAAFRAELAKLVKQQKSEFEPAIRRIKREIREVDERIGNLLDAIEKNGIESASIMDRLKTWEGQQVQLKRDLALQENNIQEVEPLIPRALDRYRAFVEDLPTACVSHAAPVREKLSTLLGGEVMMRRAEHGGWEGSYKGAYAGLIRMGMEGTEMSDETLRRAFRFQKSDGVTHEASA